MKHRDFLSISMKGIPKNRRLLSLQIAIVQVLPSRILSVHGEVAERPKAAVC